MAFVRPRLVVPTELARLVSKYGRATQSPSGRLTFVGPFTVQEAGLSEVLEDMTALSLAWLQRNPGAPRLIASARYERELPGENDWLALPIALGLYDEDYTEAVGHAPRVECEDLSIGDAAEERYHGNLDAFPEVVRETAWMLHLVTNLGPGRGRRDLSRILLSIYRK